jgi:hypothetical protein
MPQTTFSSKPLSSGLFFGLLTWEAKLYARKVKYLTSIFSDAQALQK